MKCPMLKPKSCSTHCLVADRGSPLEGGGQGKPSRRWRTGEALSKVAAGEAPLDDGGLVRL